MIFLATAALLCASGYALLRALRLSTGRVPVDVPLAWFAGSAWLGYGSYVARGLLGIPSGAATALVVLGLPFAGWAISARVARRLAGRDPGPVTVAPADAATPGSPGPAPARWLPRPVWVFAPMAAWIAAVAVAVVLHGLNTPVHTDDAYRVRAHAPILAATGAWNPAAREVIAIAGPIPTYVPALPWLLGAAVDPVHVSASIVLSFVALLVLLVTLASTRGGPEAGWGAAFAITSMPFFAYHAASTYSDAWLGMFLAAGFAFLVAYGQGDDPADAGRALLLVLGAAMVKREGELLAFPVAVVLLAEVVRAERTPWRTARWLAAGGVAYLLAVAARVRSTGGGGSFLFLKAAAERSTAGAAPPLPGVPDGSPALIFLRSLFTDGNLGLLWWVVAASLVLLAPRIRERRLGWTLAAVVILLAEAAVSAIWLYPEFTLNHGTVHRSLLPVSAAASVWVAALLAGAVRAPEPAAATGPGREAPSRTAPAGTAPARAAERPAGSSGRKRRRGGSR